VAGLDATLWMRSMSMLVFATNGLGDRVDLWSTFNETIVFIGMGYFTGQHPPKLKDPTLGIQACHHVFLANARAVKSFREMGSNGQIGFVNVLQPNDPISQEPEDLRAWEIAEGIYTHLLYDPVLKVSIHRICW
jgi:6-phospho-beta-glucosidase